MSFLDIQTKQVSAITEVGKASAVSSVSSKRFIIKGHGQAEDWGVGINKEAIKF